MTGATVPDMPPEATDDVADEVVAAPRGRTALWSSLVVGAVLLAFIGLLAFRDDTDRSAESPLVGRPAPAIAGESILDGEPFELADAGGRFTLVNFFAEWCIPCQEEHPELVAFEEAHEEAGDARVVSVVLQDEPENVARYFERAGGDWPVLDDPQARFATSWGVVAPPESFLVAPDGTVLAKVAGGVTEEYLDSLLARYTGGAAG